MNRTTSDRSRWCRVALGVCAGAMVMAIAGAPAVAAPVPLASLAGASVQTLIDLGGNGVTAGGEQYYDFAYYGSATGTGAVPPASAVQVQAVSTGAGATDGLRFVANWLASDGSGVSSTISYDVAPVDPTQAIDQIDLMSNGTAPSPQTGTFVTTTLLADTTGGAAAAPILTTYDDGRTTPVDTTAPDTDSAIASVYAPEPALSVTDTLVAASSAAGSGGLASASVVQNLFTTAPVDVPEPTSALGAVAAALVLSRRRRSAQVR